MPIRLETKHYFFFSFLCSPLEKHHGRIVPLQRPTLFCTTKGPRFNFPMHMVQYARQCSARSLWDIPHGVLCGCSHLPVRYCTPIRQQCLGRTHTLPHHELLCENLSWCDRRRLPSCCSLPRLSSIKTLTGAPCRALSLSPPTKGTGTCSRAVRLV